MWIRIILGPLWTRAVAAVCWGLVFGIALAGMAWLGGFWHGTTVAADAFAGVVYALFLAAVFRGRRRVYLKALDGLPAAQWPSAIKAVRRGPVPTDTPVRDAAIRLGAVILGRAPRWHRSWYVWLALWSVLWLVLGAFFALDALQYVTGHPDRNLTGQPPQREALYAVLAALLVYSGVTAWHRQRRLQRRLQMFRDAGVENTATGESGEASAPGARWRDGATGAAAITAVTWVVTVVMVVIGIGTSGSHVFDLYVADQTVPCELWPPAVGWRICLQVRRDPNAAWETWYDSIDGFTFEPGYLYHLRVEEARVINPPADAPSVSYRLVKVVDKQAANHPRR
jgi:Domain of unknown function (DUF4377)